MAQRLGDITEALRGRILRGLYAGVLRAGSRLPSARELSGEFDADHRVVLGAYRELVAEGLVELRPRGGIYVAEQPGGAAGLPPLPQSWIVQVLTDGVSRELPLPDLHEWLRRCVETLRLRAVVVATTSDQLAGLCRELHDDYGLEASGVAGQELELEEGADLPVDVRRADLLVTTDAHAQRVRALAEALGKPCVAIAVRPDLVAGEWRLLLGEPVYVVVADPKFLPLLEQFFAGTPGAENLRPLVLGRDDLSVIPDGAPTYITRSARERLGDTRIPGRVLPAARMLAPESVRQIVDFIVRANLAALGWVATGAQRAGKSAG